MVAAGILFRKLPESPLEAGDFGALFCVTFSRMFTFSFFAWGWDPLMQWCHVVAGMPAARQPAGVGRGLAGDLAPVTLSWHQVENEAAGRRWELCVCTALLQPKKIMAFLNVS
jgi:hypothetical protein